MNVFDAAHLLAFALMRCRSRFGEILEAKQEGNEIRVTIDTDNGPTTFTLTVT